MATTVRVTAQHIANGERRSALWCPVALALLEAGYPEGMVHEGGEWMTLNGDGEIEAPLPVPRRVRRFDRTGKMEPFEFTLDTPPPVAAADAHQEDD